MSVNLIKIAKAVDNDDNFRLRVGIACRYFGIDMTDHLLIQVALDNQDQITISDTGTVSTSGVDDASIITSIQQYTPPST